MRIYVDKPRLVAPKGGKWILNFTVSLWPEVPAGGVVVLPGFRVMDGFIWAPEGSYKKLPSVYFNTPTAEQLYTALRESGWNQDLEKVRLREKSSAIKPLLLTPQLEAKLVPSSA